MSANPGHALRVVELFASVQGESTFAGIPCAFVRLAGCPRRCTYCDTPHARDPGAGETMDRAEVLARVAALGQPLVEVTGAEPLCQSGTPALLRALCDAGHTTLLETGGGEDTAPVDPRVHVILDIKCPGSGEHASNRWDNIGRLRPCDNVKMVLCDRTDYAYAREQMARRRLAERCPVLLAPAAGRLDPAELAAWMVRDRVDARLQLQLHRILWPGEDRGR